MLVPAPWMPGAHLGLVIRGDALPVYVGEVLRPKGKEVVIPVYTPTSRQAVAHGAVAVRVEVVDAKVEGAGCAVTYAVQQRLVGEGGAVPAAPYAVAVEGVLHAVARVQNHLPAEAPRRRLARRGRRQASGDGLLRTRGRCQPAELRQLLVDRAQNAMVHDVRRDEEEATPPLLPHQLRDGALGDVRYVVIDLEVVGPGLIRQPPDHVPAAPFDGRDNVTVGIPSSQSSHVAQVVIGVFD
mmetsp:Transcript_96904/g.289481  ORF Transcript_96904/g.289481 Transcript_96904/m.289481 type:complete len:240 (-) Transcript_96904:266-985(-)|eukprot:CAMPEP_0175537018 /NCGR_PEP_ID=MMETSP0096-20121207/25002_1 /TAXON_ID=311494 /ORGANISM="Alexandrium monilatum, Strain CCMP3105" /LENGTH=239 /DNA_ID=CAMNT_0016839841 /DNA_START=170 /DNA_END=889 /DNA_ORIENTATION=-